MPLIPHVAWILQEVSEIFNNECHNQTGVYTWKKNQKY